MMARYVWHLVQLHNDRRKIKQLRKSDNCPLGCPCGGKK